MKETRLLFIIIMLLTTIVILHSIEWYKQIMEPQMQFNTSLIKYIKCSEKLYL